MEDLLENDGMKDMELASIFVNDARSVFRHAVSEEGPKVRNIGRAKKEPFRKVANIQKVQKVTKK